MERTEKIVTDRFKWALLFRAAIDAGLLRVSSTTAWGWTGCYLRGSSQQCLQIDRSGADRNFMTRTPLGVTIAVVPKRAGVTSLSSANVACDLRELFARYLTAVNAALEELARERARGIHLMHLIGLSGNIADIREMFQIPLAEICSHMRWPVGFAYVVEAPGRLHSISAWYSSDNGRYESLRRATASIDFSLKESVIGQVLKNGTTVFIPDLDNEQCFLRKDAVREAGLKSCLAIPVMVQKQPAAILEFFRVEPIQPQDCVSR